MNITELKEKLTKFEINLCADAAAISLKKPSKSVLDQIYIDGALWRHSQDAKTITSLLLIIEEMRDALEFVSMPLTNLNPSLEGLIETIKNDTERARQTLTATEQKLKELGEL